MTPDDRRAIDGLFERLEAVEQRATEPRDREAEALIARRIAEQPHSPYYMAQTIVVQQRALEEAERRMEELERGRLDRPAAQVQRAGWGRQSQQAPEYDERQRGPWDRGAGYGSGMGGGFLGGAMQTAMGVAGGLLLGNMIGGLFGASGAHAAEAQHDTNSSDQQATDNDTNGDTGDTGSGFDDGGGFDGGGDFDMGGDF